MIFQGLSVARNCPVPLTTFDSKRGFLCNFAKNLRTAVLWDMVARVFSDYGILNLQNFFRR